MKSFLPMFLNCIFHSDEINYTKILEKYKKVIKKLLDIALKWLTETLTVSFQ